MKKYLNLNNVSLFTSYNKLSALIKLSLLSLDHTIIPKFLSVPILILSEAQLLSIFINTAILNLSPESFRWLDIFHYLHNICSIGDLFNFGSSYALALCVLILMILHLIFIAIFFVYFLWAIRRNSKKITTVQKIWNTLVHIHSFALLYPIHFTFTKTLFELDTNNQSISTIEGVRIFLQVTLYIAIPINLLYMYTFIILIYFQVQIKTSNPLSSKTRLISFMDICVKFAYPFLWLFGPESNGLRIVLLALNFGFMFLKGTIYFLILPYYKLKMLKLAMYTLETSLLFTFTALVSELICQFQSKDRRILGVILWIVLLPFWLKFN